MAESTDNHLLSTEGSSSSTDSDVEEVQPRTHHMILPAMKGLRIGKREKKARKLLRKLGLEPQPGVTRVVLRKKGGMQFVIKNPTVLRAPGTDTFVVFGAYTAEEPGADGAGTPSAGCSVKDDPNPKRLLLAEVVPNEDEARVPPINDDDENGTSSG